MGNKAHRDGLFVIQLEAVEAFMRLALFSRKIASFQGRVVPRPPAREFQYPYSRFLELRGWDVAEL